MYFSSFGDKVKQIILGCLVFFGIYVSFGFSTYAISHDSNILMVLHVLGCLVTAILYYFFTQYENKEVRYLNHVMALISFVWLIIQVCEALAGNGSILRVLSATSWCVTFILVEFIRYKDDIKRDFSKLIANARNNWMLIIAIFIAIVLSYHPYMFTQKWDGRLYQSVFECGDIYSMSSIAYYGHLAQGSGLLVTFVIALCGGNVLVGSIISNVVAMVLGAIAFYAIHKELIPNKKQIQYVLCTCIYLFSPYLMGMIGFASVDYFCMNLFTVVLYFTISRKWYLQVATGAIYAFTKEPGIIIYGCLCVGVLILDFVKNKWEVLKHIRYYGMMCVAAIWVVTIAIIGFWSAGNSSVGVNAKYVVSKNMALYIFNFGWIFLILSIATVVVLIIKDRELLLKLVPLLCAMAGFTIFSCALITVNHARYTDIIPVSLYLIASVGLLRLAPEKQDKTSILWMLAPIALSVVMLLSCYETFDPISLALFEYRTLDNGSTIISVNEGAFHGGDSVVYNRQALDMEGPFSMMVEDALKNNVAILATGDGITSYYFDGIKENEGAKPGEYLVNKEYWDESRKCRECIKTSNNSEFNVYLPDGTDGIDRLIADDITGAEVYLYVYSDEYGSDLASNILDKYDIIKCHDYTYRGWTIHGIFFN